MAWLALFDRYCETLPERAIEANTLRTIRSHMDHVLRILGSRFDSGRLSPDDLQRYVQVRSKEETRTNRPISPTTIRKELVTLGAVWRWAKRTGHVDTEYPNEGIKYPKEREKPPFETIEEIKRKITRGGLTEAEQAELWNCLFLTLPEIDEILAFVKERGRQPFIYPMFVFAAHTGARRSEMIRSEIDDIDFDGKTALIREKKRVRGKLSTRRVPLSPLLVEVLREWIENHPGGRYTFCLDCKLPRAGKIREIGTPLTRDEAHDHFKRALAGSKWDKLRGWHVFRHSFCSNCAAKGIDQRIINTWVGHQTKEMVRRYRHLIPNQQQEAIRAVFGEK